MPSTNINNTFFHSSYKEAWRNIIPQGLTQAETDFLVDVCHLDEKSRVLDLMCGYGRHALALGHRGIPVTAVDNLPEYVTEINEEATENNLPVRAVVADVLTHVPEGKYDAVICMGNSFAFFDRPEAVRILKTIATHLNTSGKLIINSWMVAEIALKHFKEKDWHYAGEYKCLLDYKYFISPARIESEQTIISPDGSIEVLKGVDYIFTLDELDEMFVEAGLKTRDLFGTPRKKRFSLGDGHIYIVAEALKP